MPCSSQYYEVKICLCSPFLYLKEKGIKRFNFMCFFVACGMHSMNICEFSESDSEVCHENWPLDGHYLEVAGVLHILSAIRAAHLGVLYMCFVQMCVWVCRFACFVKIFYCMIHKMKNDNKINLLCRSSFRTTS